MENSGGSINVYSEGLNKGTRFTFTMKMKKLEHLRIEEKVSLISRNDILNKNNPEESLAGPQDKNDDDRNNAQLFQDVKPPTQAHSQIINQE